MYLFIYVSDFNSSEEIWLLKQKKEGFKRSCRKNVIKIYKQEPLKPFYNQHSMSQ